MVIMAFYVQCVYCNHNTIYHNAYNDDVKIDINIVGECVIEIKCKNCDNEIHILTEEI